MDSDVDGFPERRWDTLVTCVLCTIPLFNPSVRLVVCSMGAFNYSYIVAMEIFQPILVTF